MQNPLNTVTGTIVSGVVALVVIWILVRVIVSL